MTIIEAIAPITTAAVLFCLWLMGAYWFHRREIRGNPTASHLLYMLAGIVTIGVALFAGPGDPANTHLGIFRATLVSLGMSAGLIGALRDAFLAKTRRDFVIPVVCLTLFACLYFTWPLYTGR